MKNLFRIIEVFLLILLIHSCNKDDNSTNDKSIKDGDGNVYTSVIIGTQVWLVENLKTTKYNDGISIPLVLDDIEWGNLTTPGYCWYSNDELNKPEYGALYNWYVVNTNKLCPTGWHIPNNDEWITLSIYLGDESVGGKLKETGTTHWLSPNTGATNETGFTALPGGYRNLVGTFYALGHDGHWWNSTEYSAGEAYYTSIYYNDLSGNRLDKQMGFSVRCLKN